MSEIVEPLVMETRKLFNNDRHKELMNEPPRDLQNYKGDKFHVDKDVFYKLCQYVYNLTFKNLDILGLFGGEEGTGKSTDASQIGAIIHYIMVECNVISEQLGTYYEYNEDNCLSHNLISFLKKCDKYNDNIFRILICDEAGGLKSEERWDEWNKKFREEMRKDRKKLRIRLVCYPQPFELVKDFTLARVNFMRISEFREDKKQGLIPDIVKTIIIPRGRKTFSWHTHEEISKREIKAAILDQTKERYTKEFQNKYIYKTSRKSITFCFDPKKYIKQAKEENRLFLKEEKIFITNNLINIFGKYLTAGKIGLSTTIPKDSTYEEKKDRERERLHALSVSKFVNKCRNSSKKIKEDE